MAASVTEPAIGVDPSGDGISWDSDHLPRENAMKKLLVLVAVFGFAVAAVGCGSGSSASTTVKTSTSK